MLQIALASIATKPGDVAYNFAKIEKTLEEISKKKPAPDMVLFPEASVTGGFPEGNVAEQRQRLENITRSALLNSEEAFCSLASRYQIPFCSGFIERQGEQFFITHKVWAPGVVLCCQRKLFAENPRKPGVYSEADGLESFVLHGHRCAVMACADWMLPETTILASLHGISIILGPTGGYSAARQGILEALMRAKIVHTDSVILGVFGSSCEKPAERVMAALAMDNEGMTVVCESKVASDDIIKIVDIPTGVPRVDTWGGCAARLASFNRKLSSYYNGA